MNEWIRNHLNTAWQRRKDYLKSNCIKSFRFITREELALPVSIDIYALLDDTRVAVINIYNEKAIKYIDLEFVSKILQKIYPIEKLILKERYKKTNGLAKKNIHDSNFFTGQIEEYQAKYYINLENYLDTGIYLDYRGARRFIAEKAGNKVILDLFAYTGTVSVAAKLAGALKTFSVDLSKTYCEWIKLNLQLNKLKLSENWVYNMESMEFLKYADKKKLRFDLVVCDVPTFATYKGGFLSVKNDHLIMLEKIMKLLKNDGEILFSNHYRKFRFAKEVYNNFKVKDVTSKTLDLDFRFEYPVEKDRIDSFYIPESKIHKAFLLKKK